MNRQRIAVLGSTGSIGKQTLDIIEKHPELFEVEVLTSNNNWELLARQAVQFNANSVVIGNETHYPALKEALKEHDIKLYAGADAIEQITENHLIDCVVVAIVGYAGLAPTLRAASAGKKIALANKEALVVAGEIVMETARRCKAPIIPVDSEHSAIFQCLVGEVAPVEKIFLTASGGPFFGYTRTQLETVTLQQALNHPSWSMGHKITIDSATMMNKGFEVIEAKWLFDLRPDQIEVLVHRDSVVHSMVQFADGAVKAQLGSPDMRQPIQYALTFPQRIPLDNRRIDFRGLSLGFAAPDCSTFRCLPLAYHALEQGGNMGCIVNAANEIAVSAFLRGQISFTRIPELIETAVQQIHFISKPTLSDYRDTDQETRIFTEKNTLK